MRAALISIQSPISANLDHHAQARLCQIENLEQAQTIAIAESMRDGGSIAPMIICQAGSRLEERVRELSLPHIAIGSAANPFRLWRLWQWQRRHGLLAILSVGMGGVRLARRLWLMHGKDRAFLNYAFFMRTHSLEACNPAIFRGVSMCFCGTGILKDKLEGKVSSMKFSLPAFSIVAPGINLRNYIFPARESGPYDDGRNFAFGMAQSLEPGSGALLVIRAMAGIWQTEGIPPWEIRMFGGGSRFAEIMEEAQNLGVASRLSILEDQPLGEVCANCQAWLAPGSSPDEFPATLWAGFAAGLPVIMVKSGLHKERMRDVVAALGVDTNNPQDLAKAMIAILRDKSLREQLAGNGDQVRKMASLQTMAQNICAQLETLPATRQDD